MNVVTFAGNNVGVMVKQRGQRDVLSFFFFYFACLGYIEHSCLDKQEI